MAPKKDRQVVGVPAEVPAVCVSPKRGGAGAQEFRVKLMKFSAIPEHGEIPEGVSRVDREKIEDGRARGLRKIFGDAKVFHSQAEVEEEVRRLQTSTQRADDAVWCVMRQPFEVVQVIDRRTQQAQAMA